MPIPTHEDAMLPVLRFLQDGEQHHRRVVSDAMADHFGLSAEERAALLPSGKAPRIRSRTVWALAYLKQAGLVRSPKRGWYEIAPRGREALAAAPVRIDNAFLVRYPEFREFRTRSRPGPDQTDSGDASHQKSDHNPLLNSNSSVVFESPVPPDEALESAYSRLRASVETELLETVKAVAPEFFEQLVIDLLVKMGYGGNRQEAARAVGRSGDGGIDGVIDEDRLGLDAIYVQAKRWEAPVGRPDVQKFAGALQGQRARKGIFITTSQFTREAQEYADRIDTRIVLIDGNRLSVLMFDYDVGVSSRTAYVVKDIDSDYFEEA